MYRAFWTVCVKNDLLMGSYTRRFFNPRAIIIWEVSEILMLRQDICFKTSHRLGTGSLFALVFFPRWSIAWQDQKIDPRRRLHLNDPQDVWHIL